MRNGEVTTVFAKYSQTNPDPAAATFQMFPFEGMITPSNISDNIQNQIQCAKIITSRKTCHTRIIPCKAQSHSRKKESCWLTQILKKDKQYNVGTQFKYTKIEKALLEFWVERLRVK